MFRYFIKNAYILIKYLNTYRSNVFISRYKKKQYLSIDFIISIIQSSKIVNTHVNTYLRI